MTQQDTTAIKPADGKLTPDERRRKMRQLIGIAKLARGENPRALKDERLSR